MHTVFVVGMTCALLGKSGPRGPWSPWSPLGTSKFKSPNQQVAIPLSSIGVIVFSCAQNPGVIFMDEVALAIAAAPQAWPVLPVATARGIEAAFL